jgi:hypothetical protein
MTKNQVPDLLNELQNEEAYVRNDAIKKIIKWKINDDNIIAALKDVVNNDSSMSVRNFARSTLNSFGIDHSAFEEPIAVNTVIENNKEAPDETVINENPFPLRFVMGLYALTIIPACFCATQAGYAFDGGYTPEAQTLYWGMVSFPVTILVSIVVMRAFYNAQKYNAALLMAVLPVIHFVFLVSL